MNSLKQPRKRLAWPDEKPFRILSLDGGGIRGLFMACLLQQIQLELITDGRVEEYFDLIAGTSTGGIIAIGLGFHVSCDDIVCFYKDRGCEFFPPDRYRQTNKVWYRYGRGLKYPKYDHRPLETTLREVFGNRLLGESDKRLTIPSCMVPQSEIAVFKTDHHPDYKRDYQTMAWEVCRATSAAPTYFAGHERNGRMFIDGGFWANNPILVAVTEALSCFEVAPSQVQVLSIGTGNRPLEISLKAARGGTWNWMFAIEGAMHLSTENASSQVKLFIGHQNVVRIEPEHQIATIDMDDWSEAVKHLPDAAIRAFTENKDVLKSFFETPVAPRDRFYTTP